MGSGLYFKTYEEVCFIDNTNKILVTTDESGKKLVVIPQVIFKGKRSISWKDVESYLNCYIGEIIQIAETNDNIHIGSDFVDEYANSEYRKTLKGALAKAKANMAQGILELVRIATKKRWSEDYQNRHKQKAKKGWYRYNTRFALPVTDENEKVIRYNVYSAVIIVRHASDDKLYLYDIQNIRKE